MATRPSRSSRSGKSGQERRGKQRCENFEGSGQCVSATAATTLAGLRRLTNLKGFALPELQELFLSDTEEGGTITRDAFHDCFVALSGAQDFPLSTDPEEADTLRVGLCGLYAPFDTDGDAMVGFTELTSGLSVLCGGDRNEKAAAAFALCDYNSDGVVSLEEMTRYLTAVFKVMYHAEPGTEGSMCCTAEEPAAVTASQKIVRQDKNLPL